MSVIETERLLLSELTPADVAPMRSVLGDDEVMRFSDGVMDTAAIACWIESQQASYQSNNYGLWAIVEKSSRKTIGYCGLTHFLDIEGQPEVEVGYRLARAWWGQGFATEAASGARDYAFHSLGLSRLVSLIDPDNTSSMRVAEKLGMHCEREVVLPSYDHPDYLFVVDG